MFRMEGNYVDGFKVICMDGLEMKYDNSLERIILVTAGAGDLFLFVKTASPDYWQLKHVDKGSFINETQYEACLYGSNDDPGNRILFIDGAYAPYEGAPLLSTADAPKWHYLLNCRAERVLKFRGLNEQIYTEAMAEGGVKQDSQLFRFEGTYKNGFKIVSKLGGELKYNSSTQRFTAAEAGAGDITFKFEKSSNLEYGNDKWAVWHSESKGINAHNTKVDEVTIYNLGDNGSVWEFIHVSRLLTITVNSEEKGTLNKGTGLFVDSSEIAIVATPKPHFGLVSWTVDDVNTPAASDTLKLTLDKDITLAANFAGNDTLLKTLTVTTEDGQDRLFPAFNRLASVQTARVPYSATSISIRAEVQHELSLLVGDTGTHTLSGDSSSYNITVTAESGATKIYTIEVRRVAQNASSDVSLTVTAGEGTEVVTIGDDTIKVSLPSDSSRITIAASVPAGAVFVGDTGTFVLAADQDSMLSITVLAEDAETSKTYTIIAHHKSNNPLLKSLAIFAGSATDNNLLSPAFSVDRTSYTATVSKSEASVTIAAAAQSSYATVAGSGNKTLAGAADTLRVTVTSEEGQATATYTIVMRYRNNDATLKSLVITGNSGEAVALSPEFSPSIVEYTVRTASPSVTVTAASNDENASVNPARRAITLQEGNNLHQITVTAEDGVATKTYSINIVLGDEETAASTLALDHLTIYPNPATDGVLTIENGDLKAGEQVELYSMAGIRVATFEASAGAQTVINVSHLPKGAYIVKLGKRTAKIVKN